MPEFKIYADIPKGETKDETGFTVIERDETGFKAIDFKKLSTNIATGLFKGLSASCNDMKQQAEEFERMKILGELELMGINIDSLKHKSVDELEMYRYCLRSLRLPPLKPLHFYKKEPKPPSVSIEKCLLLVCLQQMKH